ncbi:MAG TPA: cyclase family protein [Bryobacteraceae bacterium]|jgi:kynurenine formamidase
MIRLVDLSHTVESGMITYKGLPAPRISEFLGREASRSHYAPGVEFHIARIEMVANTGTYIDAPSHRYAAGKDIARLPLEAVANLPAIVVHAGGRAIRAEAFSGLDLGGKAVLVHTGWDSHWGTETYFEGHPFLTREAARRLIAGGAALAGIDSYNIDDTADPARPVHSLLLEAEIPVCEHLTNLKALPEAAFRFFAVPVKMAGCGSFPVRAFALVEA